MASEDEIRQKRRKAHEEIVDTSNGALFLRIVALEREIRGLKLELQELRPMVNHAYGQTARIGGGGGG